MIRAQPMDAVVLIGSISAQYAPHQAVFGTAAACASSGSAYTPTPAITASTFLPTAGAVALFILVIGGFLGPAECTADVADTRELGVDAIVGPREIDTFQALDTDGKILGIAASYQQNGHDRIGFNTDAPVVPQEELPCPMPTR